MKKIMLSICMILLFLPVVSALTASIGNSRAIIRVEGSPDDPAILERTLQVNNRNDIPVKVTLLPDSILSHFITIFDNEFILQPGETKDAKYVLRVDRGGKFDGKINVGFWPEDPEEGGNGAGLSAALIILSEGPVIEFPPESEEQSIMNPPPVEVVPGDPSKLDENATVSVSQETFIEPVVQPQQQPDQQEQETSEKEKKRPSGPSPLAGVLIIFAVIVIGVAGYLLISKK